MDFKLQLQNIADLSSNISEFCNKNLNIINDRIYRQLEPITEEQYDDIENWCMKNVHQQIKLINEIVDMSEGDD